jgi:triosephosphate isomerase
MRYLVGTNIKMYLTGLEALDWIASMNRYVPETDLVDVALFPTLPALSKGPSLVSKRNIGLGAQNMASFERGAYTGEISVLSLKEMGLTYIELGHHERRLYFGETDELVRQKIDLAMIHGLKALVCLGEDEGDRGDPAAFLAGQTAALTRDLNLDDPSRLIIAYEPRWAIGVAEAASPGHAQAGCAVIRRALVENLGSTGTEVRIIYGGSVRLEDAPALLSQPEISGLFIGRAALDIKNFARAVNMALSQAEKDRAAGR